MAEKGQFPQGRQTSTKKISDKEINTHIQWKFLPHLKQNFEPEIKPITEAQHTQRVTKTIAIANTRRQ